MGDCVEKLPHDCGSRDGLQVFKTEEGGYDGFCFKCRTYVSDPYQDMGEGYAPPEKPKRDYEAELKDLESYSSVTLHDRKLNKSTLDYFGIKVGMSTIDGITPNSVYFPYSKGGKISAYKVRLLDKKVMWFMGDTEGITLCGWDKAISTGSQKLFITEGEFDMAALWQMITRAQEGTAYADRIPAVVSLSRGAAGAVKDISASLGEIQKHFNEVVLVLDNDEAGKEAVEAILKIAPDFLVATLPCKDANDCLIQGHSKAAVNACMWKADVQKNTRVIWGESLHDSAREQATLGDLTWPWEALNRKTRNIRYGETIYIGAGVKMGKSEVVNAIGAHLIKEHGIKILMAKPEEANNKTYKLMAGKIVNRIFHDPNIAFDYQAYDEAGKFLKPNLAVINLYQHLGWPTLKADIREAATAGCKAIFIDPITNLTNGMEAGEANIKLQAIAQELSSMAMDFQLVIFIFCHLKAPDGGLPHERGGKVLSTQFAGSRAMMRSCNYMFGLEGNKDPELPDEERNIRHLVLLEDREFGETGQVGLFWNRATGQFVEL